MLTLSQSLPPLLGGETYLCHFASGGVTFSMEAIGFGRTYSCNITGPGVIQPELEGFIHTGCDINVKLFPQKLM